MEREEADQRGGLKTKTFLKWSGKRGSNPRPPRWQRGALNQLSYSRITDQLRDVTFNRALHRRQANVFDWQIFPGGVINKEGGTVKIYTKQGDTGATGLFGGEMVSKDSPRIHAYGTLDELNALLGLVLSELLIAPVPVQDEQLRESLERIQAELFQVGAELATPYGKVPSCPLIESSHISSLEQEIDTMEETLPPLKTFILPGGSRVSALLHLARTVCRRAERMLVALHQQEPQRNFTLQYLNRLGDHLFVCARYANRLTSVSDMPWKSPLTRGGA